MVGFQLALGMDLHVYSITSQYSQIVYGGVNGAIVVSEDCVRGSDGKIQWMDLLLKMYQL